jgi:hypothetical protein
MRPCFSVTGTDHPCPASYGLVSSLPPRVLLPIRDDMLLLVECISKESEECEKKFHLHRPWPSQALVSSLSPVSPNMVVGDTAHASNKGGSATRFLALLTRGSLVGGSDKKAPTTASNREVEAISRHVDQAAAVWASFIAVRGVLCPLSIIVIRGLYPRQFTNAQSGKSIRLIDGCRSSRGSSPKGA